MNEYKKQHNSQFIKKKRKFFKKLCLFPLKLLLPSLDFFDKDSLRKKKKSVK